MEHVRFITRRPWPYVQTGCWGIAGTQVQLVTQPELSLTSLQYGPQDTLRGQVVWQTYLYLFLDASYCTSIDLELAL